MRGISTLVAVVILIGISVITIISLWAYFSSLGEASKPSARRCLPQVAIADFGGYYVVLAKNVCGYGVAVELYGDVSKVVIAVKPGDYVVREVGFKPIAAVVRAKEFTEPIELSWVYPLRTEQTTSLTTTSPTVTTSTTTTPPTTTTSTTTTSPTVTTPPPSPTQPTPPPGVEGDEG